MKNKKPTDMVNTLVRWGIMLFLAYIFWHSASVGTSKPMVAKSPTGQSQHQAAHEPDCGKNFSFPLMSVPLFPEYVPAVRITDTVSGKGNEAVCGQKVTIKYSYADMNAAVFEKEEKEIIIGDGKLLKGLELGLLGMRAGGTRKVTIPAELAYFSDNTSHLPENTKGTAITSNVELMEIMTPLPVSSLPLRAMNNTMGKGRHIECGDRVSAAITIWKLDGTQLFSTEDKPVSFIYGHSRVPYGIEQAVGNLMESGENTVIIPPAYSRALIEDSANPSALPFTLPENEIVVARVGVVGIGNGAARGK